MTANVIVTWRRALCSLATIRTCCTYTYYTYVYVHCDHKCECAERVSALLLTDLRIGEILGLAFKADLIALHFISVCCLSSAAALTRQRNESHTSTAWLIESVTTCEIPAFGGISLALRGNSAFGAALRVPPAPILHRLRRR